MSNFWRASNSPMSKAVFNSPRRGLSQRQLSRSNQPNPNLVLVAPVLLVLGMGLGILAALLKEAFAQAPMRSRRPNSQPSRFGARTRMHVVPSHPLAKEADATKRGPTSALDQREESAEQSLPTPPLRRLDANDIGSEPETTSFMAATPDQKLDRRPVSRKRGRSATTMSLANTSMVTPFDAGRAPRPCRDCRPPDAMTKADPNG